MKRSLPHNDGRRLCEFLQQDQKGHWQCRLLQFSGQPIVFVTPHGRLEWATSSALHLLQRYWPERHPLDTRLPLPVRKWMTKCWKRSGGRKQVSQETIPLVISQPFSRLIVRTLHDGTFSALLFEEQLLALPLKRLVMLGLTRREAEVLHWIAQGKTSQETASILGISPLTVTKHLTRVYQHFGVENRHAAVAAAWEAVRSNKNNH